MLTNLQDVPSDDKQSKLTEIREYTLKLSKIMKAQAAISTAMETTIKTTGAELQTQRHEYKSGTYLTKEKEEIEKFEREAKEIETTRKRPRDEEEKPSRPAQQQPAKKKSRKKQTNTETQQPAPKKKERKQATRPKYCTPDCMHVDGEMVGCDNPNCSHGEWFHLACVGLKVPPGENKDWFCPNCRKEIENEKKEKKKSRKR